MRKCEESLHIPIESIDGKLHKIHLKHLWTDASGPIVVMFHGIIENGRIFYKGVDKGLGNFLADQGFNVYIVDFRGRGQSQPSIDRWSQFGQHETIVEDIPGVIDFLCQRHNQPLHVICHSYGGVLFSSAYVRAGGFDGSIASLVCFGSKRQVKAPTLERWFKINLVWNRIVPIIANLKGFFDAKKFRIGVDSETAQFIEDTINWIRSSEWLDTQDGYNYKVNAQTANWPKTWHFSAIFDHSLGHRDDVQRFIDECQIAEYEHTFLSKKNGHAHNYDHINMLTHPLAEEDHFSMIVSWLIQNDKDHRQLEETEYA